MKRLQHVAGELIDRNHAVEFTFEGRSVHAYRGDTISSALAANGVNTVGRSFKYHRPRGLLSAANHDANAMVQVRHAGRSIPNVRADVVPVQQGWIVSAVNTRGGLANDRLAALGLLEPFLPVGFYYKAFHSKRWFPRWERMFRSLAGLGEVDLSAAHHATPKRYDFCDVLVVGAGPSGLAASLAAAKQGASVLLVDETPAAGGSGLYARGGIARNADRTTAMLAEVSSHPRIRLLTSTYAAGYYADHWVALVTPGYLVKVRSRSVIIAQGAYEQPAVFRGNDLPGVMLASAAQRLIYRYAVAPATRVVVLTANAQGYEAALDALAHGIELAAVLDLRAEAGTESRAAALELVRRGIAVHYGVRPVEAVARRGEVGSFIYRSSGGVGQVPQRLDVDGVWMSVGFAPANALLHQADTSMRYAESMAQFAPEILPAGIYACGKVNGAYGFEARIADGQDAGAHAAARLGFGSASQRRPARLPQDSPTHPYPIFPHPRGGEFVDFDEDLQIKDLENACLEGFDSSELLKRFSTFGMGPSQGKHSNMNALRILSRIRARSIEELGTTTARPMFYPVPLAHLAGRAFTPERRSPLDTEHAALGAVWMSAGNWRRPEYYVVAGKSREAAIADEVRAVRQRVGLIDVSTLGKIEVHGPDAAEFLERVYAARFADLQIGMTRYGLLLDEAGIVVDDGVVGRLGQESFYFTTTTGNSVILFREFGRLATAWGLQVGLVNLTGHYAAFNVAGPLARAVLGAHTALDMSESMFPYLGIREAQVAGAPCRILRAGFVGEVAYEIHVPSAYAVDLWRTLLVSGSRFQIQPFGIEAQRMLRLEKGHIIVGQDTDGLTNALEINARRAIGTDKRFFIGQRSLRILARQPRRQTLVGFGLPVGLARQPRECHLVVLEGRIAGRVTSVGWSPTLERCIGLALVDPELATGGRLRIRIDAGEELEATILRTPFYDAKGERQRLGESVVSAEPQSVRGYSCVRRSPVATWFKETPECPPLPADAGLRFEDLSWRSRCGCKGPGAEHWLGAAGYQIPSAPNSAVVDSDGILVARLGTAEFLIEALHGGFDRVDATLRQLGSAVRPPDVYPVARFDLVVSIEGRATNALLRQICSVDFAPLLEASQSHAGPFILTSMIGVSVAAWPRRIGSGRGVDLWIDPSFANYFWMTLLECGNSVAESSVDCVVRGKTNDTGSSETFFYRA